MSSICKLNAICWTKNVSSWIALQGQQIVSHKTCNVIVVYWVVTYQLLNGEPVYDRRTIRTELHKEQVLSILAVIYVLDNKLPFQQGCFYRPLLNESLTLFVEVRLLWFYLEASPCENWILRLRTALSLLAVSDFSTFKYKQIITRSVLSQFHNSWSRVFTTLFRIIVGAFL